MELGENWRQDKLSKSFSSSAYIIDKIVNEWQETIFSMLNIYSILSMEYSFSVL